MGVLCQLYLVWNVGVKPFGGLTEFCTGEVLYVVEAGKWPRVIYGLDWPLHPAIDDGTVPHGADWWREIAGGPVLRMRGV